MTPAHDIQTAARIPLIERFFGCYLVEQGEGKATMAIDFRPEICAVPGCFQGAIISALAEYTGNFAAMSVIPANQNTMTVDQTIKFLAPARGNRLIARGHILRPGRTMINCQVDLHVLRDGQEYFCAAMLQTNYVSPPE